MEIGRKWLWMVGVAALAVGAACGDDDDGDDDGAGNVPADGNPPAAQVSFEQQIHPVLVAKCGACHGTAWGSSNVSTSYQAALLEVETSTPANSDLYERGNGESGHAKVFSDAEAALVLQWIRAGREGPGADDTPAHRVVLDAGAPDPHGELHALSLGDVRQQHGCDFVRRGKDTREHGCSGAERAPHEGHRAGSARRRRQAERRRRADDPDVDPGGRDEQLSGHLQARREPPERELGLAVLDLARLARRDRGAELAPAEHRALLERRAVALVRRVVAPLPVRARSTSPASRWIFSDTMPGSGKNGPPSSSSRSGAISMPASSRASSAPRRRSASRPRSPGSSTPATISSTSRYSGSGSDRGLAAAEVGGRPEPAAA